MIFKYLIIKVLTYDFMALCLDLISQDIVSKGHILYEIIFGIDDSGKIENKEKNTKSRRED